MHPVDDGTTVSPLNLSDCNLCGLGCVPAMTTALAVATPDDIKLAVDYLLGQNHFAFPEVAFRALRENVKAGNHEKWEKNGTVFWTLLKPCDTNGFKFHRVRHQRN